VEQLSLKDFANKAAIQAREQEVYFQNHE